MKRTILAIIDGLTPEMLDRGIESGQLRALPFLREAGLSTVATTTFPSVTPVCLSSIATGAHPDRHHIPSIVWYHRGERRLVEYGSSFSAMRAVGAERSALDAIFNMSHAHLSGAVSTLFEVVEDAGLVAGAINFTCYRGRRRHSIKVPGLAARNGWYEAAYGPRRFFFFNLFESDETGAGLAVRNRLDGSVDDYAAAVGRWLVTRDGFDFLVFYLPDYDYAAHMRGPDDALDALRHADACMAELIAAAGGTDEFLERYSIVVCSDHGQTPVSHAARLQDSFPGVSVYKGWRDGHPERSEIVVAASNRAGMVYRQPGCSASSRELAESLDDDPAVDIVLFRENGGAVARRAGEETEFRPSGAGWNTAGKEDLLDEARYPNGLERAWHALECQNAGDLIISPTDGYEFSDAGGRTHLGGGSHGALTAGDSIVPVIAAGLQTPVLPPRLRTTDLASIVLRELEIEIPASMRASGDGGV